jgi:hypothetical protein
MIHFCPVCDQPRSDHPELKGEPIAALSDELGVSPQLIEALLLHPDVMLEPLPTSEADAVRSRLNALAAVGLAEFVE